MSDVFTMIIWLAKGTAVLVLAMGLSAGLRRAPAGARYVVWLAALTAVLLVPVLSTWTPLRLAILPAQTADVVASLATSVDVSGATRAATHEVKAATSAPSQSAASPGGRASVESLALSASSLLLGTWLGVAALLCGWLVLGALKVRRIVRGAHELTTKDWLNPMYDIADRLGLANAPRVIMSSDVEMPFACGVVHPTIVLPSNAMEWSDERRRVVLFHELAHVRRRDLLGHTMGRFACVLYWFHPLVWSAAKRLRAESERACDDLVLDCGGARASDYASHLLDIVTGVRQQGAPATALPMADKREFEGRMLAILDPAVKRATANRAERLAVNVGFGALALSLAAVAPTRQMKTQTIAAQPVQSISDAPSAPVVDGRRDTPRVAEMHRSSAVRDEAPAANEMPLNVVRQSTRVIESTVSSMVSSVMGANAQASAGADTALLGRILRTDKDAGVRKSAAWALQGRRDGVPLLLERLRVDEDGNVREMSAWALAAMPSDDVAAALAQALTHDADDDVRGTAAWGLGHMASRANVAALQTALSDQSPDVREKALWALGQQRIETAPKRVVELLLDEEKDVRTMAAWVLGEIRDQSTMAAIRDAFGKERDHDVQEAEFRDLLLMGDRSQALIDRAMASEDPDIRARAVRLIAGHDTGPWPWPWPWPEPRPEP